MNTDDNRHGDWIQTYSGRRFYPLDPRPDEVRLPDIAHALSMMCRFTGHCHSFYSVAEHSILVSRLVSEMDSEASSTVIMWALLHDASEAYLVDVARPVKRQPELAPYREAEARVMRAVCDAFGLPHEEPEVVRKADALALSYELRDLMPMSLSPERAESIERHERSTVGRRWIPCTMGPHQAEDRFRDALTVARIMMREDLAAQPEVMP